MLVFFLLFLLGVAMMMLGVALCLGLEVKWPQGRRLKPSHRLICGAILLSFFPLVLVVYPFIQDFDFIVKQAINLSIAFLCLTAPLVIVFKTTEAASSQSKVRAPAREPIFVDEANEIESADDGAFDARGGQTEKNPFDFS